MERIRNSVSWLLLAAGLVLEFFLLTSLANQYRDPGQEFGFWGVEMGSNASQTVAWIVVAAIGFAFIAFWAALQLAVMAGIIGTAVLIQLLWGRELPHPQDEWGYGLAFLLGALAMFVQAVSRTDFLERARERLGRLWGGS